jgi:hypothetical protein
MRLKSSTRDFSWVGKWPSPERNSDSGGNAIHLLALQIREKEHRVAILLPQKSESAAVRGHLHVSEERSSREILDRNENP